MAEDKPETSTPEDDGTFISDVRSALESFYTATQTLRSEIWTDFRFLKGGREQWKDEDLAKLDREKRPVQSFNVIHPIVNFIAGYQLERDQDYRANGRGSEDEQLGRIATALMKYGMQVGYGQHATHQLFRKGITCGLSVMEVGHTYEFTDDLLNGDCSFDVLPENAVYWEAGSRRYDHNDAKFMGKMMWMLPSECIRRWPKHEASFLKYSNRDWLTQDQSLTGVPDHMRMELYDEKTGRVRVLQHWYRVPVTVALVVNTMTGDVQRMESEQAADDYIRNVYNTAGKQQAAQFQMVNANSQTALINGTTGQAHTFVTPDAAVRALDTVRKQAGMQAAQAFELITRPTTALRTAHLTGWERLDDKPASTGSDWRFPFAVFTCYQDTDDLNSIKGVVRDIRDPQTEVNWHHATMLDTIVRGPKSGVWVSKMEHANLQRLKSEISRAGFIGEYNGQPPVPVTPAIVSPSDLQMLEFGIEIIMRITGINAEMVGQTTQKTVSGRSIEARQAGGLVGISSMFANWQRTKLYIGELLLRNIQRYYTTEKMNNVIGQEQRYAQMLQGQMQQMQMMMGGGQPQPGGMGMGGPVGAVGQGGAQLMQPPMQPPQIVIPQQQMFEYFERLQQIDFDIALGFQDASPTAREAVFNQLMALMSAGFPIPPELLVESSNVPFKEEIKAALMMRGMQPPNPGVQKAVSATQGSQPPSPNGVNTTA